MSKTREDNGFEPIILQTATASEIGPERITATVTLKGNIGVEFERMCKETGLNRSQLLNQMVHHCLNRSKDLREFYRRLAILAE